MRGQRGPGGEGQGDVGFSPAKFFNTDVIRLRRCEADSTAQQFDYSAGSLFIKYFYNSNCICGFMMSLFILNDSFKLFDF